MKSVHTRGVRTRPVNLTLSENLVIQAKEITDNPSGVVESLLSDFVANEQEQRIVKVKALEATIAVWNGFHARQSSFADDHSTL